MSRRRFPVYDIEEERQTLGGQIRDMIEAEDALAMYRERMEAKYKPKEKKEDKPKRDWFWTWIMLGSFAIPVAALWLLTIVGSVVLAARMLKGI